MNLIWSLSKSYTIIISVFIFIFPNIISAQSAIDTIFSYQGYLRENGTIANGNYDMKVNLYNDSSLIQSNIVCGVTVRNGLFSVELDFGPVFNGENRWLEIGIAAAGPCDATTDYTYLTPMQQLNATPYSMFSLESSHSVSADFSDNSNLLDGYDSSYFLSSSGGSLGGNLSINGTLSVGTSIPNAQLSVDGNVVATDSICGSSGCISDIVGNLSVALSGTVGVNTGSAVVTGTGTSFTTEINEGDPISIAGEILTVAAVNSDVLLTLNQPHSTGALGATAYTDPDLFSIKQGNEVQAIIVDKSGNVGVGTAIPGAKLDVAGAIRSTTGGFICPDGTKLNTAILRNYIDGFILRNDATDPDKILVIGPGQASSGDNDSYITTHIDFSKRIDDNWTPGNGQGGLASALSLNNDAWYHVFVISRENGTVDAGFDTDIQAVNLLADAVEYSDFRRIGSIKTDSGSNIYRFTQTGNVTIYDTPVQDQNVVGPSTPTLFALTVPTGVRVRPLGTFGQRTGGSQMNSSIGIMVSPDVSVSSVDIDTAMNGPASLVDVYGSRAYIQMSANMSSVITNTSGEVKVVCADVHGGYTGAIYLVTHGYIDFRGKE